MGYIHCQRTCILCRDCAHEIEGPSNTDAADVLGYRINHCRRHYLSLPISTQRLRIQVSLPYVHDTKICVNPQTRMPIALQWMFPTPLAILLFIAPESPWWLVRKGRLAEAEKAVKRLGRQGAIDNPADKVAMMQRTIELEKTIKKPSLVEIWKGTDLYRTLIVCGVYASQNLTGNLIANQAVFFFKRESRLFISIWQEY